jgi:hypothetical protein
MYARKFAIAAVAIAATVAAASVEARTRDDVQLSVTIGSPAWSVRSIPVHGAAYGPAFVAPRYYGHPGASYRSAPTRWDRDGDGIPNRFDRVYNPRWDRDGDGIPNRFDRRDNLRQRHDGRGAGRW